MHLTVHLALRDHAEAAEDAIAGAAWAPEVFTGVRIDAEPVRPGGEGRPPPVGVVCDSTRRRRPIRRAGKHPVPALMC